MNSITAILVAQDYKYHCVYQKIFYTLQKKCKLHNFLWDKFLSKDCVHDKMMLNRL